MSKGWVDGDTPQPPPHWGDGELEKRVSELERAIQNAYGADWKDVTKPKPEPKP